MDNRRMVEDFHLRAIERFGNTVISEKRIKKHGIERIEAKFKEYGYNVKIIKSECRDYIGEQFQRSSHSRKKIDVTYIAQLERERPQLERERQ